MIFLVILCTVVYSLFGFVKVAEVFQERNGDLEDWIVISLKLLSLMRLIFSSFSNFFLTLYLFKFFSIMQVRVRKRQVAL